MSAEADQVERVLDKLDALPSRTEAKKKSQQAIERSVRDANAMDEASHERDSQATHLVKLTLGKASLFHSGDDCFATIPVGDHDETYALKSRGMRRWLTQLYFELEQKAPNGEAVRNAVETLAARAKFKGEERETFVRVAAHDGKFYLDLCNPGWQVVEIGREGWRVIESCDSPVRFRRAHGMQALPVPINGGEVNELRRFLNVADDDDFKLLVGYLLGCYRERGPYPALVLHGEQGSCKTTAARVLRDLIDPNKAAVRAEPREVRDLMIAANNGWVVALDNLSHLPPWLSDCLCRLSTGGGFGTRTLYENEEETIFEAQRPAILNGIAEIATRGDLLDRAIVVYLPRIDEGTRLTEEAFYKQFDAARPRLLGALLNAVSAALCNVDSVNLVRLPRMADFARWVTAAEPALGWESGSFVRAYTMNREGANELTLEASPVAAAIRLLDDITGTATELLAKLTVSIDEKTRALKNWPKDGRSLSNALRRLAPNLAAIGVEVTFENPSRKTGGRRLIAITRRASTDTSPSPSTPSTPNEQNQGFSGDDNEDHGDDRRDVPSPAATPKNSTKVEVGGCGDDGDARDPGLGDEEGCEL